jgi:hypothetical protein
MSKDQPSQIHFGPPVREWPPEVQGPFKKALEAQFELIFAIRRRSDKLALVDRLIELTTIACNQIENLWKKPEYRPLVEASARGRHYFPLIHTNLIATPFTCGDEIKEKLQLMGAPGNEKGKRGKKVDDDLLNKEIECFVLGVLKSNWLRVEIAPFIEPPPFSQAWQSESGPKEVDVIDAGTRAQLMSHQGRKDRGAWADAFIEKYIRPHRPDLLSSDGKRGKFRKLADDRFAKFKLKNPDEKNFSDTPWRGFKALVTERLRKFDRLIKSAIPPI